MGQKRGGDAKKRMGEAMDGEREKSRDLKQHFFARIKWKVKEDIFWGASKS